MQSRCTDLPSDHVFGSSGHACGEAGFPCALPGPGLSFTITPRVQNMLPAISAGSCSSLYVLTRLNQQRFEVGRGAVQQLVAARSPSMHQ